MAVPSSGSLSLFGLAKEKTHDNYGSTIPVGTWQDNFFDYASLTDATTGAGNYDPTNTNSSNKPDNTTPHKMSEWYGYDPLDERYDIDIFTANQSRQDFKNASEQLKKHVYDYVVTDSEIEKSFVQELDNSEEVVVYAKLPRGFLIPTPVGDYNPDWAISFKEGSVRHIYFVAETKGSMSSMDLRQIEKSKIDCARKFFYELGLQINQDNVKYDVVTDYGKLMEIVSRS